MISAALALLRALPLRSWAIVGALAGVLILLTYCTHQATVKERDRIEATNMAAALAAGRRNAAATATAADERLADARTTSILKEDLTDAVSALPDARPSDRRVALNCERLRQQGADPATVPACVRLAGRAQAATGPG